MLRSLKQILGDAPTRIRQPSTRYGFWPRLMRDTRANAVMIAAFTLLPLIVLMGTGIDVARGYTVKTRMQQACDASAIAGRRAMVVGSLTTANVTEARNIFNFNFPQGALGTALFTPSISLSTTNSSTVIVKASTTMPTTIMKMFGVSTLPVTVQCASTVDQQNTDVVFVLNVAASMGSSISDGSGGTITKIAALKAATKAFYDALGPGDASTGRIRYGFLPYSMSVNVGRFLGPGTMSKSSNYASRYYYNGFFLYPLTYELRTQDATAYMLFKPVTNPAYFPEYPNDSAGSPVPMTTTWAGCIEQNQTVNTITATSPLTIPKLAYDLNIDLAMANTIEINYRAYWPEVNFWTKEVTTGSSSTGYKIGPEYWSCPPQSRMLLSYTSRSVAPAGDIIGLGSFNSYIDSLTVGGKAYDDVGMIWGAHFVSGKGIFDYANKTAPNGGPINRHIVLITDSQMAISGSDYSAYGIHRQRGNIGPITISDADLTAVHKRRFEMICQAAKDRSFTIWVVVLDTAPTVQLSNCATSANHIAVTTNAATLAAQLAAMAKNIGVLRVSN